MDREIRELKSGLYSSAGGELCQIMPETTADQVLMGDGGTLRDRLLSMQSSLNECSTFHIVADIAERDSLAPLRPGDQAYVQDAAADGITGNAVYLLQKNLQWQLQYTGDSPLDVSNWQGQGLSVENGKLAVDWTALPNQPIKDALLDLLPLLREDGAKLAINKSDAINYAESECLATSKAVSELNDLVQETQRNAANASQTAADASALINAANNAATSAQTVATRAETQAQAAYSEANQSKTTADAAQVKAQIASELATQAKTAADSANAKADVLTQGLESARTQATAADTNSQTARVDASHAREDAERALQIAIQSKALAEESKAESAAAKIDSLEAKSDAENAERVAEDAKSKALAALRKNEEFQATVSNALNKATEALSDAENAQTAAANAANNAEKAYGFALQAKSASETAQTDSAEAKDIASGARNVADDAKLDCEQAKRQCFEAMHRSMHALEDAQEAKDVANGINGKAQTALDTANGAETRSIAAYNMASGIEAKALEALETARQCKTDTLIVTEAAQYYREVQEKLNEHVVTSENMLIDFCRQQLSGQNQHLTMISQLLDEMASLRQSVNQSQSEQTRLRTELGMADQRLENLTQGFTDYQLANNVEVTNLHNLLGQALEQLSEQALNIDAMRVDLDFQEAGMQTLNSLYADLDADIISLHNLLIADNKDELAWQNASLEFHAQIIGYLKDIYGRLSVDADLSASSLSLGGQILEPGVTIAPYLLIENGAQVPPDAKSAIVIS